MALDIKADAESVDCSEIRLYDLTGAYNVITNPTGYGAPNPAIADFLTAVAEVYVPGSDFLPSSTVTVSINVFASLPSVTSTVYFALTNALLGYGTDNIPDGVYRIRYVLTYNAGAGVQTVYTNVYLLVSCNTECCIDKMFLELEACDCDCEDPAYVKAVRAKRYLIAAIKAACCGQIENAATNLQMASDICNGGDCGCGC